MDTPQAQEQAQEQAQGEGCVLGFHLGFCSLDWPGVKVSQAEESCWLEELTAYLLCI